jgi:class 3 adenylate cyclase
MNGNSKLHGLLLERVIATRERKLEIDREIWKEFGTKKAVLMSDMSGFSRLTRKHGILHFLSLIAKQRELLTPVFRSYGGEVIKCEADNFLVCFDDEKSAVNASIAVHEMTFEYNNRVPEHEQIITSHGIDFGDILHFGDDVFGDCVNIASKLGEDIAEGYETLISETIYKKLSERIRDKFESDYTKISKMDIGFYRRKHI